MKDALKTINADNNDLINDDFCSDITWAVIDNGIDASHNALKAANVVDVNLTNDNIKGNHGTFAAGIIAGFDPENRFFGVAPKCQIYDFKVYESDYSWVNNTILAMQKIQKINREAGRYVIHGVNISMGLPNGPNLKLYSAGHSPICEEANRLVDSGVVVCVAAGNEGAQYYLTPEDPPTNYWAGFVPMTITDPGNAELPITVGSTHKKDPLKYGVSSFSSKGPTGDGRLKPDVIAPGEDIISTISDNAYISSSGTSVATPIVSGVAARLLHKYPIFIGRPLIIKKIIMNSCKDIGRMQNFQGKGLVDLKAALNIAKIYLNSIEY